MTINPESNIPFHHDILKWSLVPNGTILVLTAPNQVILFQTFPVNDGDALHEDLPNNGEAYTLDFHDGLAQHSLKLSSHYDDQAQANHVIEVWSPGSYQKIEHVPAHIYGDFLAKWLMIMPPMPDTDH